jgi:hypothetical protein
MYSPIEPLSWMLTEWDEAMIFQRQKMDALTMFYDTVKFPYGVSCL